MASYLRWIILILAILFIALGIFREEVALVFRKATNICFECIGIG
ncbi:MAG: CD1871A family CXXC motif-containing protein [Eubacteriales bacterium]|nr:CD1871A family CXXC motif-containing protein [Eubacteriales bacterium]MDD3198337.1 CD1871A family CXXC motif-containing protein [Eubacteriales bacterium]MDD3503163.1 CD1871A family CXXC motif-containing protein [Eubacteriales bacterium]MDD4683107.1 CD1871A family CXXC motif-containing protein [Eubacteriales bacterium]